MITVGIVEDNIFAKAMLERLVDESDELSCLFACGNGDDVLDVLRVSRPDVLLVDIHMPGMSGVEVARRVRRLHPGSKIIMLTADDSSEAIVAALEAGACGYMLKSSSSSEILSGIIEVFNGGIPLTREVAHKMIDAFRRKIDGCSG